MPHTHEIILRPRGTGGILSKFQSLIKTRDNLPAATMSAESSTIATLSLNISLLQLPRLHCTLAGEAEFQKHVCMRCYFFMDLCEINQDIRSHMGAHVHTRIRPSQLKKESVSLFCIHGMREGTKGRR